MFMQIEYLLLEFIENKYKELLISFVIFRYCETKYLCQITIWS